MTVVSTAMPAATPTQKITRYPSAAPVSWIVARTRSATAADPASPWMRPDRDRAHELVPPEGLQEAKPGVGPVAVEMSVAMWVLQGLLVVRVEMRMRVAVHRRRRRHALGELTQAAGEVQDAEGDQHEGDREFHREPDRWRDDDVEGDDRDADNDDRHGVAETPERTDQGQVGDSAAAIEDRRHRDDVVGVGRVAHAEQEAEACEGKELGHGRTPAVGYCNSLQLRPVTIHYG